MGIDGVTDAVVAQADAQLTAHELIEVRVSADALAARTRAPLAQVLGRTALLYRQRDDDPTIVLPS